jgi:hypothetical protein
MAGFDEKCPYCDADIEAQRQWESHDYSTSFEVACPSCERRVEIGVSMEPMFETSKPMCHMCSRERGNNPCYCDPCHAKLKELSKHNGGE